jgi:hypothetical protein
MTQSTRTSGYWLILAGLVGLAFFYFTDPRWGWLGRRSAGDDVIDLAHQLAPGSIVGLAGASFILLIGIWLATRRSV